MKRMHYTLKTTVCDVGMMVSKFGDSANLIRVERYSKAECVRKGRERPMTGSPLFRRMSGIIPAHNPRKSCGAAETSRLLSRAPCCRAAKESKTPRILPIPTAASWAVRVTSYELRVRVRVRVRYLCIRDGARGTERNGDTEE